MIKSAAVRAQISQIEKYNSAVNTFYGKYGGIPGDLSLTLANQFGFASGPGCTGIFGARDGNGLIDAWWGFYQVGEPGLFWEDISTAKLIDGSFPNSGGVAMPCSAGSGPNLNNGSSPNYIGNYFPIAKIGYANFLYVYEDAGTNWYGLSPVAAIDAAGNIYNSSLTLPVILAYQIDKKIDDGLTVSGSVTTFYVNNPGNIGNYPYPSPSANPDTSATCYNSSTLQYSIGVNSGTGPNCALSFEMISPGR